MQTLSFKNILSRRPPLAWIIGSILIAILLLVLLFQFATADAALTQLVSDTGEYGFVANGVGLRFVTTGDFDLDVPGTPVQAYLYWGVNDNDPGGDSTINFSIDGGPAQAITADVINGPDFSFTVGGVDHFYYTYRAALDPGTIPTGNHTYTISGLGPVFESYGAGLMVMFQDASLGQQVVDLSDGLDSARFGFPPPRGPNTEVSCVNFEAALDARQLDFTMVVAAVPNDEFRPNAIWHQTGTGTQPTALVGTAGATVIGGQPLNGLDGNKWDTYSNTVDVAAGETWACFQIESINDPPNIPANLVLVALAVSLPTPDEVDAALGDFVWEDLDGNGLQDAGEPGVSGVSVTLFQPGPDGVPGGGDDVVVSTTSTDGSGLYLFDNLVPDDYFVGFELPAGFDWTGQDQGDDALDSDVNPASGLTILTTLEPGETDLTWDAGVVAEATPTPTPSDTATATQTPSETPTPTNTVSQTPTITPVLAALGDFVWEDLDFDGLQDAGEPGVSGVTVTLFQPGPDGVPGGGDDVVVSTTSTDGSGLYLFDNLTPGDYFVGFELPPGFAWTGQDQGDDALDSDVNPATGLTILTTLEPGETDLTWDAGLNSQTTSETPTFTPTPSDTPTATQTPSVTPTPTNTNTALPGPELVDPKTDSLLIDLDGDGLVDPGDTLRYTISITNIGGSNAVGVTFSDTPDPNTSLVVGTVFTTLGTVTEGNTAGDTSVAVDVGTLAPGASVTITFQVTIDNPLPAGVDQVANQGVVAGDNVPTSDTDDPSTDEDDDPTITSISQPAPTSTPGPNPNPTATSPLPIVDVLPFTGFAPDLISSLPPLTDSNRPLAMGDLWLEIPSQNVQMNIYGIPAVNGEYDVSWLGSNAGYLYGSAFPTWQGNTALTGHVYLADGTPGPFYNLRYLHWGDTVVLHAFGQRYTYEIRRTRYVRPDDLSVLGHEKLDWVTLITCSGYDERTNSYSWRLAAQAVLISVEPEASN